MARDTMVGDLTERALSGPNLCFKEPFQDVRNGTAMTFLGPVTE